VLYSLCETVAASHARIIDIRQFVLQQNLLLVVLLEYEENSNEQVLKELLFNVKRMPGMDMDFELLDRSNTESLERQSSPHAITVINARMTFKFLAEFCKLIETRGCIIREINRLSETKADKSKKRYGEEDEEAFVQQLECLEFVVDLPSSSDEDVSRIKAELMSMAKEFNTDIALQAEGLVRKIKRLVVFDMDSTLIQQEVRHNDMCQTGTHTAAVHRRDGGVRGCGAASQRYHAPRHERRARL
jgi:phosphoserine phosphatase